MEVDIRGKGGKGGTDKRSKKESEKRWEERNGAREEPHLTYMFLALPRAQEVLGAEPTPMDADLPCWDTKDRLPLHDLR